MAEEKSYKKNNYSYEAKEVKADKDVKSDKVEKLEKADPMFNTKVEADSVKVDSAKVDFIKVDTVKTEVKVEDKRIEDKNEIKAEAKIEAKPVGFKKNTTQKGVVVTVSDFSYTVKTNDGKGVHVVGKHNKKIGDAVTL